MSLQILAHRGNVAGPNRTRENRASHLIRAVRRGFAVEFDVQLDREGARLVLAHDPCRWSAALEPASFFEWILPRSCHALNVKNLLTLPALVEGLRRRRLLSRCVLFDFELLTSDVRSCDYLMRSLTDQGCAVAYRASEREPRVEALRRDAQVHWVWLDELSERWVCERHVRGLAEAGKTVWYVSPDLHGESDLGRLRQRWDQVVGWGAHGICTDYAAALSRHIARNMA